MDNNIMMQMMQMMMQQNQMMTQFMMQQMVSTGQTVPASNLSPVMLSNAAVVSPDVKAESNTEVQNLKAEIERLKSELAAAQNQITTLKSQIKSQVESPISQSFSNPSFKIIKDAEEEIEGQRTLQEEIEYNERHGKIGHENYKRIMEQLSPEERERVKAATFLDSTGVFDVDLKAIKEETSYMDAFYELFPEAKPDFGPIDDEVNELGF